MWLERLLQQLELHLLLNNVNATSAWESALEDGLLAPFLVHVRNLQRSEPVYPGPNSSLYHMPQPRSYDPPKLLLS